MGQLRPVILQVSDEVAVCLPAAERGNVVSRDVLRAAYHSSTVLQYVAQSVFTKRSHP